MIWTLVLVVYSRAALLSSSGIYTLLLLELLVSGKTFRFKMMVCPTSFANVVLKLLAIKTKFGGDLAINHIFHSLTFCIILIKQKKCLNAYLHVLHWYSTKIFAIFFRILQEIAATCSILQLSASSCNILQHLAASSSFLHLLVTSCSILQHLAASCSILQHLVASCRHCRHL